ncbi:MAG: hypothetical protein ACOCYU_00170 [Brevefilum sp.]
MRKKSIPVVSIILYVLAALLLGYSIWAAVYSSGIISEAVAMQQLIVQGNEFEVISFYMQNIAQYFLFGVVLFALGWILQNLPTFPAEEFEEEEDLDYDMEQA